MLPAKAPYHNKGFVIVPKEAKEEESSTVVCMYQLAVCNHGTVDITPYIVGVFVGRIGDKVFQKKLQKARAIMYLKGIYFIEYTCPLAGKEYQSMSDMSKYKRMLTKAHNEYNRRKQLIEGDLFYQDRLKELDVKLRNTIIKLKERYHITD